MARVVFGLLGAAPGVGRRSALLANTRIGGALTEGGRFPMADITRTKCSATEEALRVKPAASVTNIIPLTPFVLNPGVADAIEDEDLGLR